MRFENINRNLRVKPKSYMAWCTYFIAMNFHNLINLQQMLHLFFSNVLCEQVIKQAILLGSFQPLKTCWIRFRGLLLKLHFFKKRKNEKPIYQSNV